MTTNRLPEADEALVIPDTLGAGAYVDPPADLGMLLPLLLAEEDRTLFLGAAALGSS